jgi:hypothetical protein
MFQLNCVCAVQTIKDKAWGILIELQCFRSTL